MMTTSLTLFDDMNDSNHDTPLPLLVAKRWDFPLAATQTDDGMYYAVQDWINGLTGKDEARKLWAKMVKMMPQLSTSSRQLPYLATNGKIYQLAFVTDKGLYLIAQYLRVTKARPVLDEIKRYLAAAGVFADEVRRDANTIVSSGALTPDQAIDAAIQAYRAQGKDDNWIRARLEGKIKRNDFTAALTAAVADTLTRRHYATATDDIYRGLWGRTAAYLKLELNVPKKASLRDYQPALALDYQRIAEGVSAQKLGQRDELTWDEARTIVQQVAAFIGRQAKETSELLQMDLATGYPLLSAQ
ncbi:MAG: hypothetical protein H7Y11_02195 [Armatimonadetes bacterium]|nr:hypothetical protein [Anaerolineae bacterium]